MAGPAGVTDNCLTARSSGRRRPDTYTTRPGSSLLFPSLCLPTGTLKLPEPGKLPVSGHRGGMMPKRRRTRAQNCARSDAAERRLNGEYVAERNKPPPL